MIWKRTRQSHRQRQDETKRDIKQADLDMLELIPIRVLKRNSQMRKVSHRFKLFRNRIEKVETFA